MGVPFHDTRSFTLAITGGTDAHSTACSEMRLEAMSETEFCFTFELA